MAKAHSGFFNTNYFGAFLEEIVFRGLIQGALDRAVGRVSIPLSTLLFIGAYVSAVPVSRLPFITLVGLYFGLCAWKTQCVLGISFAHAVMNLGLFVIQSLWR